MTRGNQRELARAKNQKKQQDIAKQQKSDGLTVEQRKFSLLPGEKTLKGPLHGVRSAMLMAPCETCHATSFSLRVSSHPTQCNGTFKMQKNLITDAEMMREKQKKKLEDEAKHKAQACK